MSFKTTSRIFDKSVRVPAIGNLISKNAREFKRLTQERMIKGLATGRTYARKRGPNFTRRHRASAKGQRPAVDTGTLVNAIRHQRTGEYQAKVDIAEKVNPVSGTIASEYGEILQDRLDRPIMSEADAVQAEAKLRQEAQTVIQGLT